MGEDNEDAFCIVCDGEWQPARSPVKANATKPMPKDTIIGDVIGLAFKKLKVMGDLEFSDDEGDDGCSDVSSDDGSDEYMMRRPNITKEDMAQDETVMNIPDGYYYYQKNRN